MTKILFPLLEVVDAMSVDGHFGVHRGLCPSDPPRTERLKGQPRKKILREHDAVALAGRRILSGSFSLSELPAGTFAEDPSIWTVLGAVEHVQHENNKDKVRLLKAVMNMDQVEADLLIHDDICHFQEYASQKKHAPDFSPLRYYVVDAFHVVGVATSTSVERTWHKDLDDDSFMNAVRSHSLGSWGLQSLARLAYLLLRAGRREGLRLLLEEVEKLQASPEVKAGLFAHETLAYFTLHMVHFYSVSKKLPLSEPFADFVQKCDQILDTSLYRSYYSDVLIHGKEARTGLVFPDLLPLPDLAVCFTARNRFAVLQQGGSVGIYNLQNELSKKFDPPVSADFIFPGGNNRILLKSEEKIVMYDLTARKTVDEVSVAGGVRYVVWSPNGVYVAFMSKHNVLLAGKNLEYYHSFHENIRVKSGAWDENGVFVYSTLSHVKYCLPNGDSGIIHSLANPIYIARVHKQMMYYIDREQKVGKQRLNCSEYLFKLALHKRNFNDVKLWISNGRLCGNAVIGYLKSKGFPEVALHFVEDQQTRFNLALEYGHIEEAMTAAQELDERSCWNRLGLEALRQGNQQIVEMVYQKTKNFDALSFLYLITGNIAKLRKMLKIAEMRGDVMSRFHNALMLGQVEERVKIMAEMGQVPLAALTARAHRLTEYMEKLEEQLQGNDILAHIPSKTVLLVPPVPLCRPGAGDSGNWPLLTSTKKIFEKSSFEAAAPPPMPGSEAFLDAEENPEDTEGLGGGAWGEEETALDLGADMGGGDWGGDLDLGDLGGLLPASTEPQEEERGLNLTLADSCQVKWLRKRRLPADLVAAGDFEEALGLLKRRLGLMNAEPLEPIFKQAYWATCTSLPSLPQMVSINWPLLSEGSIKSREIAPMVLFTPQVILERVKEAHKMTSAGKFNDALAAFRSALQSIPISVANDANEERQLTDMIEMCREYVTFARLQVTSKKLTPDKAARQIELNAYLTCCKLQQFHQFLTLKTAMGIAFKNENFVTAASFAKRMIQGNFGPADKHKDDVQKARQVLQICEQK
ncbi:unnamed protein product, partial [Symbiodinium necroappetens]